MLKVVAFRVQNFKNVEDSEWISLGAGSNISCVYFGKRISPGRQAIVENLLSRLGIRSKFMTLDGYSINFITATQERRLEAS